MREEINELSHVAQSIIRDRTATTCDRCGMSMDMYGTSCDMSHIPRLTFWRRPLLSLYSGAVFGASCATLSTTGQKSGMWADLFAMRVQLSGLSLERYCMSLDRSSACRYSRATSPDNTSQYRNGPCASCHNTCRTALERTRSRYVHEPHVSDTSLCCDCRSLNAFSHCVRLDGSKSSSASRCHSSPVSR
jgi:hypothetical protein